MKDETELINPTHFEMYKMDSDGLYVTEEGHVFSQGIMDDIEDVLTKILENKDEPKQP